MDFRFRFLGGPVINSHTPGGHPKGTIEDTPGVLVDLVCIYHALGRYMAIENKGYQTFVKANDISLAGILSQGLLRLL